MMIGLIALALMIQDHGADAQDAQDAQDAIEAEVAANAAAATEGGAVERDWDRAGVDMLALLAARPGGIEANQIVMRSRDGVITAYFGRRIDAVRPTAWTSRRAIRVSGPGSLDYETGVTPLTRDSVLVTTIGIERVGTAYCYTRVAEAELLIRPTAAPDGDDDLARDGMAATVDALNTQPTCQSFRPTAKRGVYRVRYFRPDGVSLPALDDSSERATIEPVTAYQAIRR